MKVEIGQHGYIRIDQQEKTYEAIHAEAIGFCEGLNYNQLVEALEAQGYIALCEVCGDYYAIHYPLSNYPDVCEYCKE